MFYKLNVMPLISCPSALKLILTMVFQTFQDEEEEIKLEINVLKKVSIAVGNYSYKNKLLKL